MGDEYIAAGHDLRRHGRDRRVHVVAALRTRIPPTAVVVFVAVLILLLATPLMNGQASAVSTATLQDRLQENRSKLEKARDAFARAKATRKAAQDDIAALDKSIDRAEESLRAAAAAHDEAVAELAVLRDQLDTVTIQLNQKRNELRRTETDLQTQQQTFSNRLVNVYKSGGRIAYLAALLEPVSLAQFLGRFDLLSTIVDQDNIILMQIKDLKVKVEEQKAALEKERARVASLEQQQRVVSKTLKAREEEKQEAVDELEVARAGKEKVLAAAQKDMAAWSKQEQALENESSRIAEEIRASQSSAAGRQASSVGGGSGQLYRPVPGAITSAFGYRMHPIFHVRKMHTGVDMHAGMGTPIHAAAGGTVLSAGWRGGYGKCVVISHGDGLSTLYGHLSSIRVLAGDGVGRGQVIGEVGSTGYSTGPHLHFEVRIGGSPVDPASYL